MKILHNDSGISEIIGIILMVSVVVLGAAIISVTITSEPAPEEIPNADIIIGCEGASGGTFNVTLFHNGGDTLIPNNLEVRAYDSDDQPIEITLYEGESTHPFAVSDTLTFSTKTRPARISVLYTGGTSSAALKSLDIGSTAEDDLAAWDSVFVDTTVSPTPTQGSGEGEPTPTPGPCHDVLLWKDKGGQLEKGGFMEFRVKSSESYIKVTGTVYNLAVNDTVRLVIGDDGKGQIYADVDCGSPRIYRFDKFNGVSVYINGEYKESGVINDIDIRSYDNLASNLTLVVPASEWPTLFIVDDFLLIPRCCDSRQITLYNLKPGSTGHMALNTQASNNWLFRRGSDWEWDGSDWEWDGSDWEWDGSGVWYYGGAENYAVEAS